MRLAFFAFVLASSAALAQQPPIKLNGLKPQNQKPVQLTPPDQLFKKDEKKIFFFAKLLNTSKEYETYLQFVEKAQLFQHAIDTANGLVTFDKPLPVIFEECGKPSAHYSPDTGTITVCSEMVKLIDQVQTKAGLDAEATKSAIQGALYFIFFHELGHALVHRLELPVTGREEDVVDQFATLLLMEQGEEGMQAALQGAAFFMGLGDLRKSFVFWDEHSLDQQRFYNIACWIYGASPFAHVNLVASQILPKDRAARCGNEFAQMHKSWKTIADPKLKRPLLDRVKR